LTLSLPDQQQFISQCRHDPAYFWKWALGSATVYDKQLEMSHAVRDHPRVAVVGANGTGKDWQAARIMLWWQSVHYPAITVVLGPTHRQVSDIIWKEARSAYQSTRMELSGEMLPKAPRWELDDRHYAVGFATNDEFNIQGYHSPNLLVIITEAHNVLQGHIEAIKRLNPTRMLLTGNAFADTGEFYDAFHGSADLYHTIEIGVADTPNIQQGREVIPGMITAAQVEERRREWGEESALYIASVLGKFPDNLEDSIVPRSLLMAAVQRELEPEGEATLACDVARFGADKTVVYRRQGNVCRLVWKVQGRDTQEVAGRLKIMAEDDPDVTEIIVDDTGVGGGVTDRLNEENVAGGRVRISPFNGGERARRPDRYVNAIAEAWLELGQAFRDGMIDIDDNPAVIAQLSARRYTVQGDRRIKLESKDDFKKRSAGGSPDDADALAMCYAAPGPGVGVW
jgi:phage terminase large subunit